VSNTALHGDFYAILDLIAQIVTLNCYDPAQQCLNSRGLSYYADSMRLLAKYNMLTITHDDGQNLLAQGIVGALDSQPAVLPDTVSL